MTKNTTTAQWVICPTERDNKHRIKKLFNDISYFISEYKSRRLLPYSSRAAFFMLSSIIPLISLCFSVVRLTNLYVPASGEYEFLPAFLRNILDDAGSVSYKSSFALAAASLPLTLRASSKGLRAVSEGIEASEYDGSKKTTKIRDTMKKTVKKRITSLVYTVVFVLILTGAAVLVFAGGILKKKVTSGRFSVFVFGFLSSAVFLVLLIVFFMCVYKFLPEREPKNKKGIFSYLYGSVVSSFGWTFCTIGYSVYLDGLISDSGNVYGSIYGSLSAVVFLMMWLNICMEITLAGGLINSIRNKNS